MVGERGDAGCAWGNEGAHGFDGCAQGWGEGAEEGRGEGGCGEDGDYGGEEGDCYRWLVGEGGDGGVEAVEEEEGVGRGVAAVALVHFFNVRAREDVTAPGSWRRISKFEVGRRR